MYINLKLGFRFLIVASHFAAASSHSLTNFTAFFFRFFLENENEYKKTTLIFLVLLDIFPVMSVFVITKNKSKQLFCYEYFKLRSCWCHCYPSIHPSAIHPSHSFSFFSREIFFFLHLYFPFSFVVE